MISQTNSQHNPVYCFLCSYKAVGWSVFFIPYVIVIRMQVLKTFFLWFIGFSLFLSIVPNFLSKIKVWLNWMLCCSLESKIQWVVVIRAFFYNHSYHLYVFSLVVGLGPVWFQIWYLWYITYPKFGIIPLRNMRNPKNCF